jgi:hypothetical protein
VLYTGDSQGVTDVTFEKIGGTLKSLHVRPVVSVWRPLRRFFPLPRGASPPPPPSSLSRDSKQMERLTKVTEKAFSYLTNCKTLRITSTQQTWIESVLSPLKGIHVLDISVCLNAHFTDMGFASP